MNDSIFRPNFIQTDLISTLLSGIDRDRWLVDNVLLPPRHEVWMRREVSVKRAAGTTAIEGAGMSESQVNELFRRSAPAKPDEAERANINAAQAYEFIDYLSDQSDLDVDELVIRQINRELLKGESELLTPGVYRRGENKIGNYIPPNQGDVPALMRHFALWLRSKDDLHPVLKAGIAHIHLVAIHPFWDGNGRTARGLSVLILQRTPFHFRKLLSLEGFMATNRDQYLTEIERTLGPRFSLEYDATRWLEFFANIVSANSGFLTKQMTDWHRMMDEMHKDLAQFELNYRQTDGLAYAMRVGKITRSDYMEITGASPVTASRDLRRLSDLGILVPHGKTRDRIYIYREKPPEVPSQRPAGQLILPGIEM